MTDSTHVGKGTPGNANLLIGRNGATRESGVPREEASRETGVPRVEATRESGVPREEATRETGVPGGGNLPGWHSRGYLPHFDDVETTQHVTFHLADSLPSAVTDRLRDEVRCLPPEKQDVEWRKRVEAWIDSGYGSCVLREPEIAERVQNAFLYFDGQRYRLLEWTVMPNHVHVLFQPINGGIVAKIVASWKKYTARGIREYWRQSPGNANLLIGSPAATRESGVPREEASPVWHREYWDRFIRNERHFQQAVEYIRQNPVKAGLVQKAEHWRWSSAGELNEKAVCRDSRQTVEDGV
jgi:REP element-mobilizing transposase RayT